MKCLHAVRLCLSKRYLAEDFYTFDCSNSEEKGTAAGEDSPVWSGNRIKSHFAEKGHSSEEGNSMKRGSSHVKCHHSFRLHLRMESCKGWLLISEG